MVGPQIGFDLAYNLGCNVRLFLTPSFGIYANWIDSNFAARGRQGTGDYVDATNTIAGYPGYPAHGTGTGIAFLTQIALRFRLEIYAKLERESGLPRCRHHRRGPADDEYPEYLCDTLEMQNPQHTSSLVLHGAFWA